MRRWIPILLLAAAPALARDLAPLRGYLESLERLGFAGAVLIAQGDELLLHEGYGLADRESGRAWDRATVSTIGSITKQFTGAAILALQEDGKLAVTDPITKYFDGVPEDKASITLHQLLTHSSGIVDLDDLGDFDPIGREEFVQRAMEQDLVFAPGTSFRYTNAGYSLLGAIIEQLTGLSYEQFLRQRFFDPLGMEDTGYILPQWDTTRFAQGYLDGERWGVVVEHAMAEDGPYWVLRANGGIQSTLADMARWCRALLAGEVLSAESMQAYWAPQVDEGGGESYYGYGWVVTTLGEMRVITHNGGNGILFADAGIVPDSGWIVLLQTNVLSEFPLANEMLGQIGRHLFLDGELPRIPGFEAREAEELAALAGRYRFADGSTVEVVANEGGLDITPLDPRAFSELLSLRPVDRARADRFDARTHAIVTAYMAGDYGPLAEAYGDRVTIDFLRERGKTQHAEWEEELGDFRSLRVLGTAFREERDETVVRFEFERGTVDWTYVFDAEAEDELLGRSLRGLDPVLRVDPDRDGDFLSWDVASGAARPLRFAEGEMRFLDRESTAKRTSD